MLTEQAIQFSLQKLQSELQGYLVYHDPNHTFEVMEQSMALAASCGVSPKEIELLKTAAAFHDIGYIFVYDGHEEKSCEIAREVLPGYDFNPAEIDRICKLIMTTKMPQSPFDLESGILCDADLDYLGRDDYDEKANNLRKELESIGIKYNDADWLHVQVNFVKQHRYHTPLERTKRDDGKAINLTRLEKQLNGF